MRIAYLSDLHLEFAAAPFDMEAALAPARDADLVVLAGDIDVGERGVARADAIARFTGKRVIYVAGNHEAYGHDLAALTPRLRQAAWETDGRVLFLERNVVRFWFGNRPLVVLGCTLWTDYSLTGDADGAAVEAERLMHDHDAILWNSSPFSPADAQALHREHRFWLESQLRKLDPPPAILIVTHHAPVPEALGRRAAKLAMAYASDLRPQIAAWPPLSWIHGHTHHRHVTQIANSVVASAPRGYGGSETYVCGIMEL